MALAERHKKVLVIDDDNDTLDVMEEILAYEGFEVRGLADTSNVFPEINRYNPDIIILDYILRGINGGDICHQIKVNPFTANVPVILMSAYPRVFNSLGSYGCNTFIAKPFDLNDLVGQIHHLISDSQNAIHVR